MGAPTPAFLPQAFAKNAAGGFITNPIPNTTGTAGRASFNLGFPPLTMQPIIAGGVPPFGQDFNGILYMLSTHAFAAQAGQAPLWSSDIATAIAGYALGTVLGSTDGSTLWFNITAANVTDPDGGSSAGWVPMFSYGITTVATTGGVVTLTPAQARKGVLNITGTLVANAAIVVPNWVKDWLIVNNTVGAFTVTVRTAAGSGVPVPQGGFAQPVGVYSDATNVYLTVTPLTIPTAVAPTPDTYVLRSNAGYVFATYLNQNSAPENVPIGTVFVETGADGYLRKKPIASFMADIFANAALTGVPTAPTAAPGTSNVQIATTAFVAASVGLAEYDGWVDATHVTGSSFIPAGWSVTPISGGISDVTHNLGIDPRQTPTQVTLYGQGGATNMAYIDYTNTTANKFRVVNINSGSGAPSNAPYSFHMKRTVT